MVSFLLGRFVFSSLFVVFVDDSSHLQSVRALTCYPDTLPQQRLLWRWCLSAINGSLLLLLFFYSLVALFFCRRIDRAFSHVLFSCCRIVLAKDDVN
jgi:hypothetical protein